jgi:hypothetical protein
VGFQGVTRAPNQKCPLPNFLLFAPPTELRPPGGEIRFVRLPFGPSDSERSTGFGFRKENIREIDGRGKHPKYRRRRASDQGRSRAHVSGVRLIPASRPASPLPTSGAAEQANSDWCSPGGPGTHPVAAPGQRSAPPSTGAEPPAVPGDVPRRRFVRCIAEGLTAPTGLRSTPARWRPTPTSNDRLQTASGVPTRSRNRDRRHAGVPRHS